MTKKVQRACGGCQECCILLDVPELDAPTGASCKHQCAIGCGIHKTRPKICRTFTCAWREGMMGEAQRPDKTGMVIWATDAVIDGKVTEVIQCTARKGSWDEVTMRQLKEYSMEMPTILLEVAV